MKDVRHWMSSQIQRLISKSRQFVGAGHFARIRFLSRQETPLPTEAYATVVIPALNEERHIADVVAYALGDPATAEVIVVDDSSIDDTATLAEQAGARVVTSSMLGKGASMHDGLEVASCEFLVYLDGDLSGLDSGIITALCNPLLSGEADFVKARFTRGAGRVTELTAKPMLKIFFPELAHFGQPLGGIVAARKSLLQTLKFEDGYGVDIALLLDAYLVGAKLVEVAIGSLEHESQPLPDLTLMANEISRVIFNRARKAGRLHVEQIVAMHETQRQAASEIAYILTRRKGRQRLLLLDMDGTVTPSRFVVELARATGKEDALMQLLDGAEDDAATRSERIANLFRFIHRKQFERVAHALPLRPGIIEFVNQIRRCGFMVGMISDSYFVAADIVRRRIFADFAIAHTLQFDNDVCTGKLHINPAFTDAPGTPPSSICKSHVLCHFVDNGHESQINMTWAIGDNVNDLELLRRADRAFTIDPKSPALLEVPGIIEITSFAEMAEIIAQSNLAESPADTPRR